MIQTPKFESRQGISEFAIHHALVKIKSVFYFLSKKPAYFGQYSRWCRDVGYWILIPVITENVVLFIHCTMYIDTVQNVCLKGTVSQDFLTFFWLKRFDLGPIWTGKNGFANFFVFAKILAKNVCPRSKREHPVPVVVDYADRMFA